MYCWSTSGIREDLADPALIDEFERRCAAATRRSQQPQRADSGKRLALLEKEIANLTDAIASGALRTSSALAQRLQAAEAEVARLQAQGSVRRLAAPPVVNVRGRYLEMVKGLDQVLMRDLERGREELRGILGDRIKLQPDRSGRFLRAEYSLGLTALLPKDVNAEIMVAGAGFVTFAAAFSTTQSVRVK